jgi:hypothetical protein
MVLTHGYLWFAFVVLVSFMFLRQASMRNALNILVICVVSLCAWLPMAPALAYDNPELLPNTQTAIIDLAKSLSARQEENLDSQLNQFETETGWKLRVLTQYDQTPGRAVKDFWGLDDHSVMLVADPRGGNLLTSASAMPSTTCCPAPFGLSCKPATAINSLCAKTAKTTLYSAPWSRFRAVCARGAATWCPACPRSSGF